MGFWELTVPVTASTSEGLANFLWEQGALGVIEEAAVGAEPRIRAFFSDEVAGQGLMTAVQRFLASLRELGLEAPGDPPGIAPLRDEAWASAWQASFPPRRVGRLFVRPPWEPRPPGNALLDVVIEPGRAFGTGHHGSTESCLALLDSVSGERPGMRVLDIGTGTGILAIAAARLGAAAVTAVDVDPDALAAAEQNATRNGCADRIRLVLGGPEAIAGEGPFDLVLANLLAHTHVTLAGRYRRLVAPSGAIILGGMLAEEGPGPRLALEPMGFARASRAGADGWTALLLRRVDA
jgi:ribosomal protein L11 methyltransferase